MKIGIFSDNFYPELSGIADSITSLSKELVKQNDTVEFYAPRYSPQNFAVAKLSVGEIDLGANIHVTRLPSISYPTPTMQGRIAFWNKSILKAFQNKNIDVIHTQLFFGVGLMALRASRLFKKPLVGTNHTAITEFARYVPFAKDFISGLLIKYVVWYYNTCDFVTAPSQSVFDEMIKFGFKKPHMVVSNPIEVKEFSPVSSPEQYQKLKEKFGLTGPTIVYAGRIAEEKNIEVVVKAMTEVIKTVPDAQFAIAGHGAYKAKLDELIKSRNLVDHVKFMGLLDKPTLADLYRASDVFAIASTSETQNMTMMQAMATAIPVVGVRARALPEYLGHGNGFVVEPNEDIAFGQKLALLLTNEAMRKDMGAKGLELVQSYTPEKIARIWQEIYQKAILGYNKVS